MAPQLFSFCLAAIVLVVSAHAQELSIVAYVPFQSQVPPSSTPPGLAGFKDRFKQAWEGSLQYINDITGSGLGKPPSLKPVQPDWVYTQASAQATFTYTEDWLGPIQFLVAAPTTFYYYDNATSSAGFKLVNIYEALPEGTTFDIVVASPPTTASPPAPPPPIFPRSPPRPPVNSTSTFRLTSSLYSNSIPPVSDTAAFKVFLDTYFDSFATMMNCANANGNNTAFNATTLNSTVIAAVCNASYVNVTGGFPKRPTNYTVTQELIPDPLANTTSTRRRQLLQAGTGTTPAGTVYNVTITATYEQIGNNFVTTYVVAAQGIVLGQQVIISDTLDYSDLALVSVAFVISVNGVDIAISGEIPAYTGGTTNPFSGPNGDGSNNGQGGNQQGNNGNGNGAGRRLIERRITSGSQGDVANIEWAKVDPTDVAYGTDKSLYEVFSVDADYYTAGAACAARGAKLASYSSEGAQIFIDILCDGAAGMQCWVEGNANGACDAVGASVVRPLSCTKAMPFVCVKDKSAITTRTVSTIIQLSVAELAASKPADVAYDTHKNLYELFSTPVHYHTAGSVCLARGAQLANYGSEAAQVFIDVLCEASSGQTCWVEGNKAGRCSTVKASDVHQVSCTGLQPFVCTKKATA